MEMQGASRLQANTRGMKLCSLVESTLPMELCRVLSGKRIGALLMSKYDCLASSLLSDPSSREIEAK
jgi:hypothetical protein